MDICDNTGNFKNLTNQVKESFQHLKLFYEWYQIL